MTDLALSYQAMKSQNQSREADEQRADMRKKSLLYLVLHYLSEEGYTEAAQALMKETSLDLTRYTLCDNCDLDTILTEYESYHFIKFQKYPKIVKKGTPGQVDERLQVAMSMGARKNASSGKGRSAPQLPRISSPSEPPQRTTYSGPGGGAVHTESSAHNTLTRQVGPTKAQTSNAMANDARRDGNLNGLHVLSLHGARNVETNGAAQNAKGGKLGRKVLPDQILDVRKMLDNETRLPDEPAGAGMQRQDENGADKLIKPLGNFLASYSPDWRELAMVVSRDILLTNPTVHWDDIVGLDVAKRLVKEAVVYPIRYPQLFSGILSPWKGLLLYGPPGTGKTLLAKAVATECKTTFFNISASTIVSKWRGDSEKLVRVLFEMARFYAPSTIFVDELDSLMSQRAGGGAESTEHEGSRRMKTELLIQMDGLAKSDDLVFLLAASNLPWELDNAMLRRLEKRILVDLPSCEARAKMFRTFLPPDSQDADCASSNANASSQRNSHGTTRLICQIDYAKCAEMSEGYSGSDIKLVCKEAAMSVIRKVFDILENNPDRNDLEQHIRLDEVTTTEVLAALQATKPSAKQFAARYLDWQKEFESA